MSRTAPLRVGYVGCGFMAQFVHLPNFSSLEGCRLVALAEKRPRLAQLVAARYGIEAVYGSHLDLAADPTIDAVAVSAGYAEQGEIARDLLAAGKHVFMEKPMAVSVAQAERILEAAHSPRSPIPWPSHNRPGLTEKRPLTSSRRCATRRLSAPAVRIR
ncbi:MAG TPA: Gfo/Idh/MocA family oxidoreductase [Chloroflexota bacterium]|nr:Gfo/Idh/MocA family oxidoreductase [Chloroflexota bacterium]